MCILERGCSALGGTHQIVTFWTAGQRADPSSTESAFVWKANEVSALTYSNWYPGEPTNTYGGVVESCLELHSASSYQWNDRPCTDTQCFVCEYEISKFTKLMPRLHQDTCCRIQVVSTCIHFVPSTCILYRRQNCRPFVARLLLDTKEYKSTVT